jgi:hypothetical protein
MVVRSRAESNTVARAVSAFLIVLFVGTLFTAAGVAQERSQGVSIHMLPKRAAELGGMAWGFSVDPSSRLNADSLHVVIQTAAGLLSFVRKQDNEVQENGVWIVTTDPDAYSDEEKTLLENVKQLCRSEKIPLFICRGSDLPNGWSRYDR